MSRSKPACQLKTESSPNPCNLSRFSNELQKPAVVKLDGGRVQALLDESLMMLAPPTAECVSCLLLGLNIQYLLNRNVITIILLKPCIELSTSRWGSSQLVVLSLESPKRPGLHPSSWVSSSISIASMAPHITCSFLACVAFLASRAIALGSTSYNGLAKTPPMGWGACRHTSVMS